jgi:CheY-like chemotaxis protein
MKGKKILIVDDAPITQNILKFFFKDTEIGLLEIANDGEEAIQKFRTNQHNLVLMDLRMPRMDGFLAIEEIRGASEDVIIIVLSGLDSIEAREKAYERGANGFLCKPFNKENIEDAIMSSFS